jgi:hypothetical protein
MPVCSGVVVVDGCVWSRAGVRLARGSLGALAIPAAHPAHSMELSPDAAAQTWEEECKEAHVAAGGGVPARDAGGDLPEGLQQNAASDSAQQGWSEAAMRMMCRFVQAATCTNRCSCVWCMLMCRCPSGLRGFQRESGLRRQASMREMRPSTQQGEAPPCTRTRASLHTSLQALEACSR